MTAKEYISASRVPWGLFGPEKEFAGDGYRLWTIRQVKLNNTMDWEMTGFTSMTMLLCYNLRDWNTINNPDCVMEDSKTELSKHLPAIIRAHGNVLVTGLGLGCVVRGLLANPKVDHIDVVEKDRGILNVVGPEFAKNSRVTLHHADALKFHVRGKLWDLAWHDLHVFGDGLQLLHARLMKKYRYHVGIQGAWDYPRTFAKVSSKSLGQILGSPKYRVKA